MALSLALNDKWDIHTDENGNIAVIEDAHAIAQNCANAVRLFTNDAYFNRDRGIPHFDIELGKKALASRSTLYNRIKQAVMGVEGVTDAEVILEFDYKNRTYGGEVIITTNDNTTVTVEL